MKVNGKRVHGYLMNVNMYVICWNYLRFSCNLMFFSQTGSCKKKRKAPKQAPCLFAFCEIPIFFLIFENISAKANGRRVDIYII